VFAYIYEWGGLFGGEEFALAVLLDLDALVKVEDFMICLDAHRSLVHELGDHL